MMPDTGRARSVRPLYLIYHVALESTAMNIPKAMARLGGDQWMSLVGHLIFGIVTALVYLPLSRRS